MYSVLKYTLIWKMAVTGAFPIFKTIAKNPKNKYVQHILRFPKYFLFALALKMKFINCTSTFLFLVHCAHHVGKRIKLTTSLSTRCNLDNFPAPKSTMTVGN